METDVELISGASPAHVLELAERMRAADVAEVLADGWKSPLEVLEASVAGSDVVRTALFNGQVAAIYGVAPYKTSGAIGRCEVGMIWLLTSDVVSMFPMTFFRLGKSVLAELLEYCGHLVNWIDARYASALRWAAHLGFTVGVPQAHGPWGEPFCFVSLRRV